MRIVIGIPTFQEADSIAHVTSQIDKGLQLLSDTAECTIVNADGESPDGTSQVFLATPSRFPKLSLTTKNHQGKGSNVFSLFEHCCEQDIDVLVLIDGDLLSVTPTWPASLAGPVLRSEADYVAPLYRRGRFDAGTTNQLAYPLLDAYFGHRIRQPIGGEFGISKALIQFLLQQRVDSNVLGYGIDIFMTGHAACAGFRIAQADLGIKRHKPSLGKSHRIFPDVATTAFGLIRQYQMSATTAKPRQFDPVTDPAPAVFSANAETAFAAWLARVQELMPVYKEWLGVEPREMITELASRKPGLSTSVWVELLAACIAKAVDNTDNAMDRHFAEQLFPVWGIRSMSFIRDNLDHSPETIELQIEDQNELFREALNARMVQFEKPTSA